MAADNDKTKSDFGESKAENNLTPLEAALRSHFDQYHVVDGTPRVTHRDSEHGFVAMSRLAGV